MPPFIRFTITSLMLSLDVSWPPFQLPPPPPPASRSLVRDRAAATLAAHLARYKPVRVVSCALIQIVVDASARVREPPHQPVVRVRALRCPQLTKRAEPALKITLRRSGGGRDHRLHVGPGGTHGCALSAMWVTAPGRIPVAYRVACGVGVAERFTVLLALA